jgi:hypothetical protein
MQVPFVDVPALLDAGGHGFDTPLDVNNQTRWLPAALVVDGFDNGLQLTGMLSGAKIAVGGVDDVDLGDI